MLAVVRTVFCNAELGGIMHIAVPLPGKLRPIDSGTEFEAVGRLISVPGERRLWRRVDASRWLVD